MQKTLMFNNGPNLEFRPYDLEKDILHFGLKWIQVKTGEAVVVIKEKHVSRKDIDLGLFSNIHPGYVPIYLSIAVCRCMYARMIASTYRPVIEYENAKNKIMHAWSAGKAIKGYVALVLHENHMAETFWVSENDIEEIGENQS